MPNQKRLVRPIVHPAATKVCPQCKLRKPATLEYFGPNKKGHICQCRKCVTKQAIAWEKKNPESAARNREKWRLKTLYGITKEVYDQLLMEQDGVCAICKNFAPLHVDHDHETKQVRGLLCFTCNNGLGNFKDDRKLLQAALIYLEPASTRSTSDGV